MKYKYFKFVKQIYTKIMNFDNMKLLDYLIIILIFTIAIYTTLTPILKNLKFSKECMDEIPNSLPTPINNPVNNQVNNDNKEKELKNELFPINTLTYGAPLSVFDSSLIDSVSNNIKKETAQIKHDTSAEQVKLSPSVEAAINIMIQPKEEIRRNINKELQDCPLKGTIFEKDKYIQEVVLGGKYNCGNTEPKDFSRQDLIHYQNNMFDFNEQINNSSSAGIDVVDKINELYSGRNSELTGNGKKISEIYDGLTQGILDRKKECKYRACLIPPNYDLITKSAGYIEGNDNSKYIRHGLKYEDDDVSTGGKFYDDIEGDDVEFEDHLLWTNNK